MSNNPNSPAMPVSYIAEYATSIGYEKRDEVHFGLTKREMFAMAAMQAVISSKREFSETHVAKLACTYADTLLAELELTK